MNLVFFTDATKHICRISRVLKQARGNCLLVGISGSGRQSLSKLATKILDYKLKQTVITKNFKMDDFSKLMIELMRVTGAELTETTFMLSDSEIKFEAQVECINNLLNTGEVPNLFESDPTNQRDQILQLVRENANKYNITGDKWLYFVSCIRQRLHIVITMNPIGEEFRARIRNFPAIVNCSAIDWFHPWPIDALFEVAQDKFQGFNLEINKEKDESWINTIIQISPLIHKHAMEVCDKFEKQTKRRVHVTPKN
jgi:dynein heavy chain